MSAAGLIGLVGYAAANNPAADMAGGAAAAADSAEAPAPALLPRENAVLVFGASGKLGRKVVERVSALFILQYTCSLLMGYSVPAVVCDEGRLQLQASGTQVRL
jgi:hypothetical protein